jgi:hypothetical protein
MPVQAGGAVQGEDVGDGVGVAGPESFRAVREGVKTARPHHGGGDRGEQLRVIDNDLRQRGRTACRLLFVITGQPVYGRHLATRVGGGDDSEGQPGGGRDGLAQSGSAPPADRNQDVDVGGDGCRGGTIRQLAGNVLPNFVSLARHPLPQGVAPPRRQRDVVARGDKHGPAEGPVIELACDAVQRAIPEDDPARQCRPGEGHHDASPSAWW